MRSLAISGGREGVGQAEAGRNRLKTGICSLLDVGQANIHWVVPESRIVGRIEGTSACGRTKLIVTIMQVIERYLIDN